MSRPYPSYLNSGVDWLGETPSHWDVTRARRLFQNARDQAYPDDEQLSATQNMGVVPQREFMEAEDQKVVLAIAGTDSFKHVEPGDFVISLRSFQGGIEFSQHRGCVSPAYTVLRPRQSFRHDFFKWLLKCGRFIGKLQSVTSGIRDGRNVSYDQFAGILLPIPPLSEQQAIAAFLDRETGKIDALIEEQRRLIALLKEKRQAVISHAVTKGLNPDAPMKPSGVPWMGDVPAHWEVKRLRHVSPSITVGIVVEPSKHYVDEGVPALRSLNVRPNAISMENLIFISKEGHELHKKSTLRAGDLVAVRTGQPGTAAVVPAELDGINCIDLIIIRRSDQIDSEFLALQLGSDIAVRQFAEGSGGAIQLHFNVGTAENLIVVVPPISEQLSILSAVKATLGRIDELTAEADRAIALLTERRAALISAAVTGKIDVREAAGATEAA